VSPSSSPAANQAASTEPAAGFLVAAKTSLESGTDPSVVATYLGHAAEAPTPTTLRLLASLLTDTTRRARSGGSR
jgi:hypothetical protein